MSASLMAVNGMDPPVPSSRKSAALPCASQRQGLRALRTAMPNVLAMTDKLSPRMIYLIDDSIHEDSYIGVKHFQTNRPVCPRE